MRPAEEFQRIRARELRRNMTEFEKQAWKVLRTMKEQRFRRQVPFDCYILDFYSPRYRLCVELDGLLHDLEYDAIRDKCLAVRGVHTLRFSHETIGSMARLVEEACLHLQPRYSSRESAEAPP